MRPPAPSVQVAVPAFTSVRNVMSLNVAPLIASPPLATVLPVPVIKPPLQVVRPEALRACAPPSVPLESVNVVASMPAVTFALSVPPFTVTAPAFTAPACTKFAVPALTVVLVTPL